MMRKSWIVVSLVILLAVGFTGCGKKGEEAKTPEPQKPAYSTYTSDTEAFSIEIPEGLKMEKSTTEINTDLGKVPLHSYIATSMDKGYMIGVYKRPFAPGVDFKKVLAKSKKSMVSLKGIELIKEWETEVDGEFALAWQHVDRSEEQDIYTDARYLATGDNIYLLQVLTNKEAKLDTPDVAHFFESFKCTGK